MSNNDLFADAARKVLADCCTPQVIREIESAGSRSAAVARLWQQLEETGLADALLADPLLERAVKCSILCFLAWVLTGKKFT